MNYTIQDADSYIAHGSKIVECQHLERVLHTIGMNAVAAKGSTATEKFLGVDIGSCDGKFGKDILNVYHEGEIMSVDPVAINPDVICKGGEEFMENQPSNHYDFIICKYSIHFISNLSEFFSHCYDSLKAGGTMYVLTMSKASSFPWTPSLNRPFEASCVKGDTLLNFCDNRFQYSKEMLITKRLVAKEAFMGFVAHRSLSNLTMNTQAEIDDCVEYLLGLPEEEVKVEVHFIWYRLHKPSTAIIASTLQC